MKTGDFATAQEVVFAGLLGLRYQQIDEFEPGELASLLAESEESIKREGTLDGDEVFAERRARRARGKH